MRYRGARRLAGRICGQRSRQCVLQLRIERAGRRDGSGLSTWQFSLGGEAGDPAFAAMASAWPSGLSSWLLLAVSAGRDGRKKISKNLFQGLQAKFIYKGSSSG